MADRIVVMHDGIVEQVGTPLDLYDRPANLFVAGFIGSPAINLIRGILRRNGSRNWVATEAGIDLPLGGAVTGNDGQPVVYGIRPEHLMPSDGDGLPVTVEVVEPTGASTFVYADLAGAQICGVFTERHGFHPGGQVRLMPQQDRALLFDAGTGGRLTA